MKITYCKTWSRLRKRSIQIWDEQKAFEAHQKKTLYTVLIGDESQPHCFLEVNLELGFLGVHFLDNKLRNHLAYLFRELEPSNLFLKEVIAREYAVDTDKVIKANTAIFQQDGNSTVGEAELMQDEWLTRDRNMRSDVSRNWEQIPEFGRYESIVRIDRWT